jgi:spore coat protein U-like protein
MDLKVSTVKKELNNSKDIFVKKSKMSLAKSTTALTCLISALIITSESARAQTTTTGSMAVSSSVASSCTISAASMTFAAYAGSLITANSVITSNCTNGTTYTISFNDTPTSSPKYYLVRSGGSASVTSDVLEVTFTNGVSTMINGAATITGTGTGSSATAGTITGTIAASQTGKTAGTFSKTMTLNLVY